MRLSCCSGVNSFFVMINRFKLFKYKVVYIINQIILDLESKPVLEINGIGVRCALVLILF